MKKSNEVIYCEVCGDYFDTDKERLEHKATVHAGSQSKLFERIFDDADLVGIDATGGNEKWNVKIEVPDDNDSYYEILEEEEVIFVHDTFMNSGDTKYISAIWNDSQSFETYEDWQRGVWQGLGTEQLVDTYSDHKNIMIEDQDFSLPPPRQTPDYNEAKSNWEGMFDDQRTELLQNANASTEYAEFSFKDIPEDVQDQIYFALQKVATTRENEQGITDDGTDKVEVKDQFDTWEAIPPAKDLDDDDWLEDYSNNVDASKSSFMDLFRSNKKKDDEFSLNNWQPDLKLHTTKMEFHTDVCADCGMEFGGLADNLAEQERTHMEETGHQSFISQDISNSDEMSNTDGFGESKARELIPVSCPTCDEDLPDVVDFYNHRRTEHGDEPDDAKQLALDYVAKWEKGIAELPPDEKQHKSFFGKFFGESDSMLKSEVDSPYEVTNRNGELIAQFVLTKDEVQTLINKYQANYMNDHYGSGDAVVVTASDGQDVSRLFDNAVQEWETVSIENIDKQLDYLLGDDNE